MDDYLNSEALRKRLHELNAALDAEFGGRKESPVQVTQQTASTLRPLDPYSAYCVLAWTVLNLAIVTGPVSVFIFYSWLTRSLNVPLVCSAVLTLALGISLFRVIEKKEHLVGIWKRPLSSAVETASRLRLLGLYFYPAPMRIA
jgi:hypothetical protein